MFQNVPLEYGTMLYRKTIAWTVQLVELISSSNPVLKKIPKAHDIAHHIYFNTLFNHKSLTQTVISFPTIVFYAAGLN